MIWPARNYECKKMDKTNSVQPPLKSSSLWVTLYMIHYDAGHPVQCTWSNMMWDTLYSVHDPLWCGTPCTLYMIHYDVYRCWTPCTVYMMQYDVGHPVQCTWSNMMWDTLYSVHDPLWCGTPCTVYSVHDPLWCRTPCTVYMVHYDAGHPVQCTLSNMVWDTLYIVHMYTVYEGSSNNVTNSQFKNNFIDIKTFLSNSATSRYSQWQPLKNKLTFARMFVYCLHLNLNTFTISFIAFFFFERGKKIL